MLSSTMVDILENNRYHRDLRHGIQRGSCTRVDIIRRQTNLGIPQLETLPGSFSMGKVFDAYIRFSFIHKPVHNNRIDLYQ